MSLFAMNPICPLGDPSLKRCVWSCFAASHHCGYFCCFFFRLHFSAQIGVAYNKTVLWKHSGVLTHNDKFKYQHRDMTKRAPKATCHRSHKPWTNGATSSLSWAGLAEINSSSNKYFYISSKNTELLMSTDLTCWRFRSPDKQWQQGNCLGTKKKKKTTRETKPWHVEPFLLFAPR